MAAEQALRGAVPVQRRRHATDAARLHHDARRLPRGPARRRQRRPRGAHRRWTPAGAHRRSAAQVAQDLLGAGRRGRRRPPRSPPWKRASCSADGPTRPAIVRAIAEPPAMWPRVPPIRVRKAIPTAWLEVTIAEGRNRQVRRMTAAVGLPTLRLVRCAVGDWTLAALAPGESRMRRRAMIAPRHMGPSRPLRAPSRRPRTCLRAHTLHATLPLR